MFFVVFKVLYFRTGRTVRSRYGYFPRQDPGQNTGQQHRHQPNKKSSQHLGRRLLTGGGGYLKFHMFHMFSYIRPRFAEVFQCFSVAFHLTVRLAFFLMIFLTFPQPFVGFSDLPWFSGHPTRWKVYSASFFWRIFGHISWEVFGQNFGQAFLGQNIQAYSSTGKQTYRVQFHRYRETTIYYSKTIKFKNWMNDADMNLEGPKKKTYYSNIARHSLFIE